MLIGNTFTFVQRSKNSRRYERRCFRFRPWRSYLKVSWVFTEEVFLLPVGRSVECSFLIAKIAAYIGILVLKLLLMGGFWLRDKIADTAQETS